MTENYKLTSLLKNTNHIEKYELSKRTPRNRPPICIQCMHSLNPHMIRLPKEYLSMAMLTIRNLDDEVKIGRAHV